MSGPAKFDANAGTRGFQLRSKSASAGTGGFQITRPPGAVAARWRTQTSKPTVV
jgi:hypothetical protein